MKTKLQFLTRGIAMAALLCFVFVSCNKEEINLGTEQNAQNDESLRKAGKIDICHYSEEDDTWFTLEVNANAWKGHSKHGDVWLDQDGDGFTVFNECGIGSMDDCDDTNPDQFPGAAPLDLYYIVNTDDLDGDGFGVFDAIFGDCIPQGYVDTLTAIDLLLNAGLELASDCDDTNASINPGAIELCDDIDDNCDGDLRGALINGKPVRVGFASDFGPSTGSATGEWVEYTGFAAGCDPILEDLTGKIAIIDRGQCAFTAKIFNAQQAGAIGVIICNNQPGIVNMAAGTPDVITIPSIFVSIEDCAALKTSSTVSFEICDPGIGARLANGFNKSNTTTSHSLVKTEFEF